MTLDMNNLPRVETLQQLADFLRTLPANDDATAVAGFDMRNPEIGMFTTHPCGTAGCIGGWVKVLRPDLRKEVLEDTIVALKPSVDLGAAYETVYPCGKANQSDNPYDSTPEQAAQAVEYLDKHNACGWDVVMGVSK